MEIVYDRTRHLGTDVLYSIGRTFKIACAVGSDCSGHDTRTWQAKLDLINIILYLIIRMGRGPVEGHDNAERIVLIK